MIFADAKDRFFEAVQFATRRETKPAKRVPGPGSGVWMVPDFDAPLTDFAEY